MILSSVRRNIRNWLENKSRLITQSTLNSSFGLLNQTAAIFVTLYFPPAGVLPGQKYR